MQLFSDYWKGFYYFKFYKELLVALSHLIIDNRNKALFVRNYLLYHISWDLDAKSKKWFKTFNQSKPNSWSPSSKSPYLEMLTSSGLVFGTDGKTRVPAFNPSGFRPVWTSPARDLTYSTKFNDSIDLVESFRSVRVSFNLDHTRSISPRF